MNYRNRHEVYECQGRMSAQVVQWTSHDWLDWMSHGFFWRALHWHKCLLCMHSRVTVQPYISEYTLLYTIKRYLFIF